jgi:hypothetical protein
VTSSTALARQQQALLADLFGPPPGAGEARRIAALVNQPWQRGFQVYQANGHAMAQAGLGAAYPVLAQLLGDDSFAQLARALWHAQPPQRGDIAQWGAALAGFVESSEQLADEPYLADVARVEWALHLAAHAADPAADPASFALLASSDPQALGLQLAPGATAIASRWPVVSLVNAHLEQSPSLQEAGQRLRQGCAETALVWREGLRPRVRQALAGEAALLQALSAGQSLGQALDVAADLDFNAWLPLAAQTGLLLAAHAMDGR